MTKIATECKLQKHHPEWSNVYNKTRIRWTTHRPEGLSSKDVSMARYCDDAGVEFGEVLDGGPSAGGDRGDRDGKEGMGGVGKEGMDGVK